MNETECERCGDWFQYTGSEPCYCNKCENWKKYNEPLVMWTCILEVDKPNINGDIYTKEALQNIVLKNPNDFKLDGDKLFIRHVSMECKIRGK